MSQCRALVGRDRCIKTLSAMLHIPTIVWLGDYPDPFRDAAFIAPYVTDGVMQVHRYRNKLDDTEAGISFTMKALRAYL